MLAYDPNIGFLLNGQQANLYGRVGRNVLDANTAAAGTLSSDAYDPRYYEAYSYGAGDAGDQSGYRLRPEYQQRLGNRTQLASHSVGGYGEVIDPSQVEWDEEFGLLTDRRNIKDPATRRDNLIGNLAMAAFAAPIAYGVALNSGLLGAAGGAGGTNLGAYSGMATGLDGGVAATGAGGTNLGAYGGMTTGLDGAASSVAREGLIGSVTQSPSYLQTLLSGAQANPLMAARALMGGASLINSLTNRNGNSGGPSGSGGLNAVPANVTPFNPGLLNAYQPLQFDFVPFMSGNFGGKNV